MPLVRRTAEDLDRERAKQRELAELRLRERLKAHTISGAVVFAAAQLLLGFLALSPASAVIGALLLAPCGAATGFLASRRNWGVPHTGLLGFACVALFLAGLTALGGGNALSVPWIIASAGISGGVPGCLVGFHISNDV